MVRPPAWKAAMPHETISFDDLCQGRQQFDLARDCGDFVVRRPDGVYGYQLAVTVDDALMGSPGWCGAGIFWTQRPGSSG